MICKASIWFLHVIEWFNDSIIDEDTIINALNWLVSKGLVSCGNIV